MNEESSALERVQEWAPAFSETAFGALALGVGVVWPPAALAGLLSPIVSKAVAQLLNERVRDGADVLDEEELGEDDVMSAIEQDAAVADLLRETVNGVLQAREREHRRMLARALANAVHDGAQVEFELRYARVASQLDVPELRALEVLCKRRPRVVIAGEEADHPADTLWSEDLEREWPGGRDMAEEVMNRLVVLGLARDLAAASFGGVRHWEATDFGWRVFERLQREAAS